jgi:hypothetical protein
MPVEPRADARADPDDRGGGRRRSDREPVGLVEVVRAEEHGPPSPRIRAMNFRDRPRRAGSRPVVGSSRKTMRGSWIAARDRHLRFMPRENVATLPRGDSRGP